MNDQEITKMAREVEDEVSRLLNDFLSKTGVDIDPKVGVYDNRDDYGRTAVFHLNAFRRF